MYIKMLKFLDILGDEGKIKKHIILLFKLMNGIKVTNNYNGKEWTKNCKELCRKIFEKKIKPKVVADSKDTNEANIAIVKKRIKEIFNPEFENIFSEKICLDFIFEVGEIEPTDGTSGDGIMTEKATVTMDVSGKSIGQLQDLLKTQLTEAQRRLCEDRLRELFSSMPGEFTDTQKEKMKDLMDTMYKNRKFDDKIKKIRDNIGEFIDITCLNKSESDPKPFENQLINIETFLRSLRKFELLIRSGKKYTPPKKEKIESIKNKEVGKKVQELETIKEPNIKSTEILKEMNNEPEYKAFKELAHKNKSVFDELIGSKNIVNGEVLYQTFSGLPNTISTNNVTSFVPTSSNTPNIQKMNTNFSTTKIQILRELCDILCTSADGFKNYMTDKDSLEKSRLLKPDLIKDLIYFISSDLSVEDKINVFLNIMASQGSVINLNSLPALEWMKTTINSRDPVKTKTQYEALMKSYIGTKPSMNIKMEADQDFKQNYEVLYRDFFYGILKGDPEYGYTPQFSKDGILPTANINI